MPNISYTGTASPGGTIFASYHENTRAATAAVVNGNLADDNIKAGANIDPAKVGDYSANAGEMQTQTQPATNVAGVITPSLPTDIRGELAGIRYMIAKITGGTFWFSKADGVTGPAIGPAWTTGSVKLHLAATPDAGWIMLNDGTIGNASSNGTNRANADTADLFSLIWSTYPNTDAPIFDSGGIASTRGGSAAADYAANKAIRLPLAVARLLGIAGTPSAANITELITGTMGITGTTPVVGTSATVFFIDPLNSSRTTNDYVGARIRFTSGVLSGTEHTINAYDRVTHQITVGVAFGGTPAAGVSYVIYEEAATTTFAFLPHATFSPKDSAYNGYTIETTGGTGSGQVRTISAYDGSQRRVTVSLAWVTQPDFTTTFKIYKTLSTRANAVQVGAEVQFPTPDTNAEHSHEMPGQQFYASSGSNIMAHTDTVTLAQGNGNQDRDVTPQSSGGSSTFSRYAPSVFFPAMVKL